MKKVNLRKTVSGVEKGLIMEAMIHTMGVRVHAASLLNLPRTTLVDKLKKYKLLGRTRRFWETKYFAKY